MKAFQIKSASGIDGIQPVELDEPTVGEDEVKIEVRAASLNYRDLGIAEGGYYRNDSSPVIPLSDAAGEIVEAGSNVRRWGRGDRVSPAFVRDWIEGPPNDTVLRTCLGGGVDGVLAQRIVMPQQSLVAVPDEWTFAQAAAVPCAAVTAFHALFESGNLTADQTVLLLGTGGVSMFALQMAKAAGAQVIMTSSSDDKLRVASEHGADELINYKTHDDWHQKVRALTNGRGVDHVVEVGGPGTLERSIKSTTVGGHIHLIGVLDTPSAKVSPMMSVFNLLTIRGIYVGSRQMHLDTLAFLSKHSLLPTIDQTFSFDQSIDAYRYFASQSHIGKIVIEF